MGRAVHPHIITPDSAMLGESYGIDIPRSLIVDYANGGGYLTKGAGGGSATKWTYSLWSKNCKVGNGIFMGYNGNNSSSRETLSMGGSGNISWQLRYGGSQHAYRRSTYATESNHMDNGGWFHFVCQWDSNNSTTADRFIIWVNGVRQDLIQYNATQSGSSSGFMTGTNYIGRAHDTTGYNAEFYLAEMHAVNNAVLAPTHFGFTDPLTGAWRPKKSSDIVAATTYGTGGWYLDFSDPSNIGADRSGNGNNWTPNGFSTSDVVFDSPTNNFCVLDNNDFGGNKAIGGNLQSGTAGTGAWRLQRGTFILGKGSGRWYWEVQQKGSIDGSNGWWAGLVHQNYVSRTPNPNSNSGYMYGRQGDTRYWNGGNAAGHFPSTANNDIIQFAFDADTGKMWSGKNGTWTGADPGTGTSHSFEINYGGVDGDGGDLVPAVIMYGSNNYAICNFGQRPFTYTPPTGFRSICSKNFAIQGPTVVQPKKHFDILTYTGDGGSNRQITGLEFQPDLLWFKLRSETQNHDLYDSVRGGNKRLIPNSTATEASYSNLVQSFNHNGFNIGSVPEANKNGANVVAWCWKAGGTAVTNTDGTLSAQVSANPDAGFSIISYTGNGTSGATIGHGLGRKPRFFVVKSRTETRGWNCYHVSLGNTKYIQWQGSSAPQTQSGWWNNTSPTSSVITVGNDGDVNGNSQNYICYAWADIPGYSKFGYFTGNSNGNTQPSGKVVRLGFKPALVILRATDSFSGSNWGMFDFKRLGYNRKVYDLRTNTDSSEGSDNTIISLDAEGFRITTTSSGFGGSSSYNYIYMAWAENPGRLPFNMPPTAS